MYNGIGLQTARGSGTNGYVTKNFSHINKRRKTGYAELQARQSSQDRLKATRGPNKGILDHERKRKIELALVELEDELEEQGVPQDEIDERVAKRRAQLQKAAEREGDIASSLSVSETHAKAAQKEIEIERMRTAFGVSKDHVVGAAFDRDLQERLKEERIAKREAELLKQGKQAKAAERRSKKRARRSRSHSGSSYSYSSSYSSYSSYSSKYSGSSRSRKTKTKENSKASKPRSRSPSGSTSGSGPRRRRTRSYSGSYSASGSH